VGELVIDGLNTPSDASPVFSVKVGIANPRDLTDKPFTVSKAIDKASPNLYKACAKGEHFKRVTLEMRGSSEQGRDHLPILTWVLTDVVISDLEVGSSRSEPGDTVGFAFAQVCAIFEGAGSRSGRVEQCWDQTANRASKEP
jgi:type VI secretion system Hcp family effector